MTTLAAIDIGYGNTKIRYSIGNQPPKEVIFRSIAAPSQADLSAGSPMLTRNTRLVEVDGMGYEVGPDADSLVSARSTRVLHEAYIRTAQYRALFLGALSYIGQPQIDRLVTGLPVHLLESDNEELVAQLQGDHTVPGIGTVTVRRVQVVAQPIGGLMNHVTDQKLTHMNQQVSLLIDPGFFTLDWTGIKGLRYQSNLTGSSPAGFSFALKAATKAVAEQLGRHFDNIDLLDERLSHNELRIGGRPLDRAPIEQAIHAAIRPAVQAIENQLADGDLFDQIVVCGGAAAYYEPVVKEVWPHHPVHRSPDPVMANVRGFYRLAEMMSAKGGKEMAA